MAKKLNEVDVVLVGLGWTGGILAKELTEAGLKVLALERGGGRSTASDYQVPNIRDELRYVVRHDLMQNTARRSGSVCLNRKPRFISGRWADWKHSRVVHGGVRRVRQTQSRGGQLGAP